MRQLLTAAACLGALAAGAVVGAQDIAGNAASQVGGALDRAAGQAQSAAGLKTQLKMLSMVFAIKRTPPPRKLATKSIVFKVRRPMVGTTEALSEVSPMVKSASMAKQM